MRRGARLFFWGFGVATLSACSSADLLAISAVSGAHGGASTQAAGGNANGGSIAGTGGAGTASGGAGACTPSSLRPGDTVETMRLGGTTRSFILHVPAAYDGTRRVPLVVDFHGMGSSGSSELTNSEFPNVTDSEGVIMAFPDGLKGPLGTAWNLGPCCVADVDDLSFVRALVTRIEQEACIDASRIYAVGVLTGGGMVYDLACNAADVFAAVAPSAFDLLQETVDACVPSRPITEISFRGTADPRVPYAGGPSSLVPGMPITFLGAEDSFARWAQINHCAGAASAPDANGCASYKGCANGVEVSLCTKQGGRDDPPDASVAWPVLKRHTLQ